jgi:hypothetical protein
MIPWPLSPFRAEARATDLTWLLLVADEYDWDMRAFFQGPSATCSR